MNMKSFLLYMSLRNVIVILKTFEDVMEALTFYCVVFQFSLFSLCENGHSYFFGFNNYMYGDIFRLIKLCFIRGFFLGFQIS